MVKSIKASVVLFAAIVVSLLLAAAPASADVSIRDAKAGDLYVRAEQPSLDQLERAFAAFWNPNIGIDPKVEVSYNGPGARAELEKVMQYSRTMDFFSLQGRAIGPVQTDGNTLSVTVHGLMAGIPAQTTTYHFIRDAGLWKFDWKRICQQLQCAGNPSFGY
ncbi:hypothetical protein [Nocardia asteroides]|uniref:hypothetical protein n=1 Tax=Nocardia asteroides TaxID=1824 RepID=UPI001E5CA053|nr:hypothetical protein [Nocardia asteroides]UGT63662.1 hypothetical protein LTT61_10260 [Nocardia asteroides]